MNWKKVKIIFSPPKTRKAPSLWTKLRRKHTVGPLGSMQAIGGPFHWENEVSSVHQCHEWCEDEHAYVHRLFPLSSVQFSCSVVSNSLRPHEPQHAKALCPSPTPRVPPDLVHQVDDAVQPSHPPSSPSPPSLNLSHHQGLFK